MPIPETVSHAIRWQILDARTDLLAISQERLRAWAHENRLDPLRGFSSAVYEFARGCRVTAVRHKDSDSVVELIDQASDTLRSILVSPLERLVDTDCEAAVAHAAGALRQAAHDLAHERSP